MSATEDVARMLTLVPWLLERPGASLDETADAFGVDASRIRADLGHLDFCGLPGLGGGDLFEVDLVGDRIVVRMADELRRPLRPTPREALRLVLTADAAAEALDTELPALRSAVAKVRAALGIPEQVADVVAPPTGLATIGRARQAVVAGRRIRLRYQGRGEAEPREREVDPWALHVVAGEWYLQGFDHGAGARRTFRLDRAAELLHLDEPATVPAPEQLPAPGYTPSPDDLEVVLDLAPGGRWLLDALEAADVVEGEQGWVRVHLTTDAPAWVANLVLMAGGQARVVSPPSLRAEVAGSARVALGRYGATTAGGSAG